MKILAEYNGESAYISGMKSYGWLALQNQGHCPIAQVLSTKHKINPTPNLGAQIKNDGTT